MKKIISLVVMLFVTLVVSTGYAQVRAGEFDITPTIGGYMFEGNEDMDNSLAVGLRAGYNFTKYIGLEGFGFYVPTNIRAEGAAGKEKTNFLFYGIEGIFNILPNNKLVPFLAVGAGGTHYADSYDRTTEDKKNKIVADYGAGLKYYLSENVALRGDVRHVIPFDDSHNNLLYTVGLTLAFGGAKKVVEAPAPVVEEAKPQAAAAPVVEEVKAQPAAPVAAAPVVVEEVKRPAAAAPEIIEKGKTTLKVLFDTNKAIIKKNSFKDVDNLVVVMKQYPELNVVIEGHTDSVGSNAYNKKLSQRRADAVKTYMVKKGGIDAKRLKAVGYGEEKPIADNKTKEGKAKNRRVEAATAEYTVKK
ncbi:MAG TPA: OmpA family protein [Candidatus Hydrogenedentes bacterium]|nr:OmpA family protein [Candidatus Hydrogenedentota bacterium]